MKIKIGKTEDIIEAKRWDEMTDIERISSLSENYYPLVTDEIIFIKPFYFSKVWMAYSVNEVQILEEEENVY